MIIAALLGALTFGACVDTEESSSVTAIRNAKAEQLKSIATLNNAKAQAEATIAAAEAQLAAAEAQLLAAEAAAINAATEAEKIANELAAAQAAQTIAQIEAQMALDALAYEQALLNAQLAATEALQTLAGEEQRILSQAYTNYFTSLSDLKAAQDALAAKKKAIADEQAKLAKVDTVEEAIDAATKTVDAAQKAYDKAVTAKENADAAVATLREQGAISYTEALATQAQLVKDLAAATKVETLAVKAAADATKALEAYDATKATAEQYYLDLQWFLANSILGTVEVDTDYDEEKVNADHIAFYPVELLSGVYTPVSDAKKAVVLFDMYAEKAVKDGDKTLYNVRDLFWGIDANAVPTYEAEIAEYLSTSIEAKNLEVAKKTLEAYIASTSVTGLKALQDAFDAQIAAYDAQIAANQVEVGKLTYQRDILVAANATYYKTQIDSYNTQIAAYNKAITDATAAKTKASTDLAANIAKLTNPGSLAQLEAYQNNVKTASEAYEAQAALYAESVETLKDIAAAAADWTATYVTEYNEAKAAEYAAIAASAAATKAKGDIATQKGAIDTIVAALAGSSADSAEYILHVELEAAIAKAAAAKTAVDTAKSTLDSANKTLAGLKDEDADKAAAALAKYVKSMTDNIAAWEAELPGLEANVVMAEAYVANCEAALDAALAM